LDTPGLTGDNIADRRLLGEVRNWLRTRLAKEILSVALLMHLPRELEGDRLVGILYLHDIADVRYTASAKRSFDLFHNLCGAPANVAIVMTNWHDKGTQYHEKQQRIYGMFEEGPWRRWIQRGEELHQSQDTLEDTKKVMQSLLKNENRVSKVRVRVDDARKRAPRRPRNKKDEWRVVRAARDDLEQEKRSPETNSPDLEGELRVLRAWEEHIRPSWGSRLWSFFM
jgi:hypothetical protein